MNLTLQFIELFGELEAFSIEKLTDETCLQYLKLVKGNLEIDYLQRIWQFYRADRENKKQDFTPPSLEDFQEAQTMARDALELYIYGMEKDGDALPKEL